MSQPSPVNRDLATAAVEAFFSDEKWMKRSWEYGWLYTRTDDPLIIIVSMAARALNSTSENFTLRLACTHYPTNPPDAIFVNPETLEYVHGKDNQFVAKLEAPYCYTHLKYEYRVPYKYGPQLVCSSMTLGYYASDHNPTPDQAWDPARHNMGSTIYTIHRALTSDHFKGRHS